MGNKTQSNKEEGNGTIRNRTRYRYGIFNTLKKSSFRRNITKFKDVVFNQGCPYDAAKYEESIFKPQNASNYINLWAYNPDKEPEKERFQNWDSQPNP